MAGLGLGSAECHLGHAMTPGVSVGTDGRPSARKAFFGSVRVWESCCYNEPSVSQPPVLFVHFISDLFYLSLLYILISLKPKG